MKKSVNDKGGFTALWDVITEDVQLAYKELINSDSQFHRRNFIRSFFSMLDGFVAAMKQEILEIESPEKIDYQTMCVLKEQQFFIDKDEIKASEKFFPIDTNLRLTSRLFFKSLGGRFSLSVTGQGWQSFQRSIKVRNRITHPKKANDMIVAAKEIQDAINSYIWVSKTFSKELATVTINSLDRILKIDNLDPDFAAKIKRGIKTVETKIAFIASHPFEGD